MVDPLVICDNLVKIYKVAEANVEVVALQGLDLEVRPGEMLALVGQSGSGKTTLLNVLGALDLPSAGRCVVSGYDLTRLNEKQRNTYRRFAVGHIWQQSGRNLLPDLTVAGNITLPQVLAGTGVARRTRRARELLELVGLADKAHSFPEQLSGGEQQRVAIAVALANEPALLLADEPTGDLDSVTAGEIIALLRRLNRELGLTVVIVTHDVAVAATADRTIAIRDGRTSTETIRREGAATLAGRAGADEAQRWPTSPAHDTNSAEPSRVGTASAIIGLPGETHRESVLIDRAGRLQLPEEAVARIPFHGRAEVRIERDHVELWPVAAQHDRSNGDSADERVMASERDSEGGEGQ